MASLTWLRLAGLHSFGLIQQNDRGMLFESTKLHSTSFVDASQFVRIISELAAMQFSVVDSISMINKFISAITFELLTCYF